MTERDSDREMDRMVYLLGKIAAGGATEYDHAELAVLKHRQRRAAEEQKR